MRKYTNAQLLNEDTGIDNDPKGKAANIISY
jgi:hypothetical protein